MNLGRILLGGIVAGVICFLGDGVVHGVLLQQRWLEIAGTLHLPKEDPNAGFPYFAAYDLAKGIASVFIYAAIRPRFGKGPGTAIIAGLITWALCIPIPLGGLLPIKFFGRGFALRWALYGAVPVLVGALIGAWLYREEPAVAKAPVA